MMQKFSELCATRTTTGDVKLCNDLCDNIALCKPVVISRKPGQETCSGGDKKRKQEL